MTTTIGHLLDDTNVGGVTRGLASHMKTMSRELRPFERVVDTTKARAPEIPDDILLVHFTMSWAKLPFLASLRLQRPERPLVIVEHTYTEEFEKRCVPSPSRFRFMLKMSFRLADMVVAVSDGQARWLREAGVVPASKLAVVRSSRDLTGLHGIAPPVAGRRPLRLAAYGRYCEQKGFEVLLEAMRLLPPGTATLTLAGYGPLEQALRQQAAGIPDVDVQGAIGDLGTFLAAHDAVVVPSRWEAFGIVATEARSAGRPLIASGIDGLSEQMAADYAIGVPPESPEALARAIVDLSRRDLQRMGAAARASAVDQFDVHIARWRHLFAALSEPRTSMTRLSAPEWDRSQSIVNRDAA